MRSHTWQTKCSCAMWRYIPSARTNRSGGGGIYPSAPGGGRPCARTRGRRVTAVPYPLPYCYFTVTSLLLHCYFTVTSLLLHCGAATRRPVHPQGEHNQWLQTASELYSRVGRVGRVRSAYGTTGYVHLEGGRDASWPWRTSKTHNPKTSLKG
eukprot:1189487-Prorocentrum_minimum.AAC.2